MIIDTNNKENLKLKSTRDVFLQCLSFINSTKKRNIVNIYYELTRTTNVKDKDLNFVFHFLNKFSYLVINNEMIHVSTKFVPEEVLVEFCTYYLSLIQSNKDINKALFLSSDFTIENDCILINVESIPFNYRIFLLVLQKLGLMKPDDRKGVVVISNYSIAKKLLERPLKKISPEEFEKEQEQQKLYGIEAEKFVVNFEFNRLKKCKEIDWVAEYIVNEGYDIISYNHQTDEFPNRFIEVKSYGGDIPYFFWSRNEFSVAKNKKDKYWLYLVNRSEIKKDGYSPIMKQNPYETILMNEDNWDKQIEKYRISLIGIK